MNGVDLNNIPQTTATHSSLLESTDQEGGKRNDSKNDTVAIFLLEGIVVHLERGSAAKVLSLLSSFCQVGNTGDGPRDCLVFCDCIEGVKDRNLDLAKNVLQENDWELKEFLATPTKTPHFGVAVPGK